MISKEWARALVSHASKDVHVKTFDILGLQHRSMPSKSGACDFIVTWEDSKLQVVFKSSFQTWEHSTNSDLGALHEFACWENDFGVMNILATEKSCLEHPAEFCSSTISMTAAP